MYSHPESCLYPSGSSDHTTSSQLISVQIQGSHLHGRSWGWTRLHLRKWLMHYMILFIVRHSTSSVSLSITSRDSTRKKQKPTIRIVKHKTSTHDHLFWFCIYSILSIGTVLAQPGRRRSLFSTVLGEPQETQDETINRTAINICK